MTFAIATATYVCLFILNFLAFGMQRTTLLISRELGVEPAIAGLLLPKWFPLVWLIILTKWGVLLFIAMYLSFWFALALGIITFVLSIYLPIPWWKYIPFYRRRIEQLRIVDEKVGQELEAMLGASRFGRIRHPDPDMPWW